MATVIEDDLNRYEVVKVLNPDGQVLNVTFASGSPSKTPPAVSNDAFGRLRVSNTFTLFDSSHRYQDNGDWASSASGGTYLFDSDEGCIDMTVNTTNASEVIRETYKVFSYQPGKSMLIMNTFVFEEGKENLLQRVGYFNDNNGLYVELNGTELNFVRRSSVSGSVVNTVVNQSNWNVDQLDGSGPSGITINPATAQIFWMDIEWLGVGNVRMGFVYNGQFVHCHTFQHANIVTTPYITTANLPLRYEIVNTGTTASGSTLKQICSTILSEGGYNLRGRANSIANDITNPISMATAGTYYPLISLRLRSATPDAIVIPTRISILGISNATEYNWRIVSGGATTGGAWVAAPNGSPVEYNITPTGFSGGTIIKTGFISGSRQGNAPIELSREDVFKYQLERDGLASTFTELSLMLTADSNSSEAAAAINWDEVAY